MSSKVLDPYRQLIQPQCVNSCHKVCNLLTLRMTLCLFPLLCAANLPTSAISKELREHVCGIYIGWAGLSNRGVYKMVMSVGYNPYFGNCEKTVVSFWRQLECLTASRKQILIYTNIPISWQCILHRNSLKKLACFVTFRSHGYYINSQRTFTGKSCALLLSGIFGLR